MKDKTRLIQFSGGAGSYVAAKRIVAEYGADAVVLLFADTMIEDSDLYRFLDDAVVVLGARFVRVSVGKTPWDIFRETRFLGNSRIARCSLDLKQNPLRAWISDHYSPETSVLYFGIDWTEAHRLARAAERWKPWEVAAPLLDPPYLDKAAMIDEIRRDGITPPRLYELGFPHNNCGGGCVKAGVGHFRHLLRVLPDVYADWERNEIDLRRDLGDVAILRDRSGGKAVPLTLQSLRKRIDQARAGQLDFDDWGGCGCALD